MHIFTGKRSRLAALALAGGLLFIAVVAGMVYSTDRDPGLTLAEAEQRVLNSYRGSIVDSRSQGDHFVVFLKTERGLYELMVRRASGDIAEIRRLEEYAQQPPTGGNDLEGNVPGKDDLSGPPSVPSDPSAPGGQPGKEPPGTALPTQPNPKPPGGKGGGEGSGGEGTPALDQNGVISEKEAAGLALKSVPGRVKDIDREEDEGLRYYLIEIETADGREAEVQLNAASGKVISVTWDDDHDEDNDDDHDDDSE
ncbi:PepSY domain-containing protein [Paenibacillus sanguinis]|uniref:PepSY domain-containing protein n=1 Tax=Paenibacillus sanguinis TaxID=225906 RepID=UPI000380ECE6|nr:PepSY domain-containing protein [Paenibacillus sanguinis]